jgi:hypothetical protein
VKLGIVGIGWNLYHSATSKVGLAARSHRRFVRRLVDRSSTSYHIHECIRYLCFLSGNAAEPYSKAGGIEQYEIQQAAALKRERPDVGVMVLRNTEVVSTFWSAFREAMNDTDLWLQSPPGSGKPINEPWGTDDPKSGGPTPKYFLNFSNPKTQTWWLEKYVGPALDQPNIDGVRVGEVRSHRRFRRRATKSLRASAI